MDIENILNWQDIIIIYVIIFVSSQIKKLLPAKYQFLIVYFSIVISFVVFEILIFFRVYNFSDILLFVKWWVGSVFLYETTVDKLKKIKIMNTENKDENTENTENII